MPAQDSSRDPASTGLNASGQLKNSYYADTDTAAQQASYAAQAAPEAAQSNAAFNTYFGPLEQKYGLTQAQLTSYFQQNPSADLTKLQEGESEYESALQTPESWLDKLASGLALAGTVGLATAGVGSALAAPAAGALGAVGGAAATGAASGVVAGAMGNLLTVGGAGIGKAAGEGALIGGVTGGASALASGAGSAISSATGLSPAETQALTKLGINVGTGALKGELNGQGAGAGAESAAKNSAINQSSGAVAGSIFSGAGSIFNSNSTINNSNSTISPAVTQSQVPQVNTNPMSSDYGDISNDGNDLYSMYNNGDTSNGAYPGIAAQNDYGLNADQLQSLGQINPDMGVINDVANQGAATDNQGITAGLQSLIQSNPQLAASLGLTGGSGSAGGAAGGNGTAGGSNSGLLGQLSSLLGGGSGANSNLLSSLLGLGSSALGSTLDSSAAKGAAATYAGQAGYNPYSVTTNNGTTNFANGGATSTLSPTQQANATSLNGLVQGSASSLAGGAAGAANQYYNEEQAAQQDGQNKFYQNNLDNQMASGVLSSTAGQYQSQAALGNISTQNANDMTQAQNFANTQQQNQLGQLTAGLSGLNTINASQLSGIGAGGQLGTAQSSANAPAYQPMLATNANSNAGNLFSALGAGTNVNSQGFSSLSDRGLKYDIKPIGKTEGGHSVYEFKYVTDGSTQVGVMAQEVPEAAFSRDGVMYVDYAKVA